MQPSLIHETIADAMREVIQAGGGFKKVGGRMRPEMAEDHAATWLRDCCNDGRRERLSPEQLCLLRRIGREVGCHALATFEARDAGYADPQPIEPADERAQLQRDYIAAARDLARMAERIERLAVPTAVPCPPSQTIRRA